MKQKLSLEHNLKASATPSEASPVIIMLNGFGSDENDLFSFAGELPDNYTIISLRATLKMEPNGNAWYTFIFDDIQGKFSDTDEAIKSRELISNCIDEIIEKYKVQKDNVTLLGFSQGTILSFAVALSYPEKIKNVIGLSGYIDTDLLIKDFAKKDFSNLNVYSSHGIQDQVVPVSWSRKTKPFLNQLSIDCTYSEFPVGHGVTPQNFYEFKEWLEKVGKG
jgi:phospholipase/carboxylesterase